MSEKLTLTRYENGSLPTIKSSPYGVHWNGKPMTVLRLTTIIRNWERVSRPKDTP